MANFRWTAKQKEANFRSTAVFLESSKPGGCRRPRDHCETAAVVMAMLCDRPHVQLHHLAIDLTYLAREEGVG